MKPLTQYWQSLNFVSMVLFPFSLLFCLLVSARRFFYRLGWLKSNSPRLPVIVVGNIYIGGNGKTPFVIWLAEQLKAAGYKPGIVSRGYGALSEKQTAEQQAEHTWPRQVNQTQDSRLFGDEPLLIQQSTRCPVIIDPARSRAVAKIENETDCDVIISDDGLQHYAMSRFIEINISDAGRLYGNGLCLPAGPLRERQSRLKSVDYIVYNISRGKLPKPVVMEHGREFVMSYEMCALQPLSDNCQAMTLDDFKGKIVHAVAGIGDPGQFFRLLENSGLKLIEHPFADHYQYKEQDLVYEEPYPIIMTEKDAVKCQSFTLTECWYLPIKAKVDSALASNIINQLKTYSI